MYLKCVWLKAYWDVASLLALSSCCSYMIVAKQMLSAWVLMQFCQFRQFTFHWLYIYFWQNMSFNQKFVSSTLLYHWHLCQWFTITDESVMMLKTVKQLFLVDMLYFHISRLFELDFLTVASRTGINSEWMSLGTFILKEQSVTIVSACCASCHYCLWH